MIELLTDLPAGVDGLRAVGEVTREDYDRTVQPLLEAARREGRRLRLLYELGAEFRRFTAGAVWEDMRVGLRYLRLFERCAVVSDVEWIRTATRTMAPLLPCPARVYSLADRQDALAWLSAPSEPSLQHRLLPEIGVLVIEPHGKLRPEDFDAVAAAADPWIESTGGLRGLVVHVREFPGWQNLGSFVRHVNFVRGHHRKIGRVALAANGKMAELAPSLAEAFVAAEVRHFDYGDLDGAIEWAAGQQEPSAASQSAASAPR